MEKRQYICPKCGCQNYESDQFQATGGNFAKIFDVQNKKVCYHKLLSVRLYGAV